MKERKKSLFIVIQILLSYCSSVAVVTTANISMTRINILVPLLFTFNMVMLNYYRKQHTKRSRNYGIGFAIPFSLSLVLGSKIDMESIQRTFTNMSFADILYFCFLVFGFTITASNVIIYLEDKRLEGKTHTWSLTKLFWILTGVFLLAWLPYYLTYFPGIISNDALSSIRQGIGTEVLNNHHPVLFTLLIKLVLNIGRLVTTLNGAMGIFCMLHMLLFALLLSYFCIWLVRRNANSHLFYVSVLYFALNPVIALYSVYITKDVLFSGCLLFFVLCLDEIVGSKGEKLKTGSFLYKLGISGLLVIFLRNNGIFIVVGTLFCFLIVYKKMWKRFAVLLLCTLFVNGVIKGPVFSVLRIPESSFAESMSIPLQQVAQTICDDGEMSKETEDYLSRLLSLETVKEVYSPGYTDPYKFHEDFDDAYLNQTKGEFLKVWAELLPKNLDSYVKAYLMQTSGYWHIGQTESLSTYGVLKNEIGIEQVNVVEKLTGISLEPVIEKVILVCRKAPLLCFFTNMAGMMFFVLLFCMVQAYRGRRETILPVIPVIILWLTLLIATPAYCKFRYLFILALMMPYLIWRMGKSDEAK